MRGHWYFRVTADSIDAELAAIIDRHFEPLRQRSEQAEARVKELQKQEAESRRLFYAEQDKRQSAEFRCEELAGALAKIKDATGDEGETWENVAAWMAAVASSALARREVQP